MKKIIFMLLFCASCCPKIPHVATETKEVVRERIVNIPVANDSALAAMQLKCDSLGNVYIANLQSEKTKNAQLNLLLQNNNLRVQFVAVHDTLKFFVTDTLRTADKIFIVAAAEKKFYQTVGGCLMIGAFLLLLLFGIILALKR